MGAIWSLIAFARKIAVVSKYLNCRALKENMVMLKCVYDFERGKTRMHHAEITNVSTLFTSENIGML